jgi:formamidopyrimidine-DNA glycosylase
MPELPEVEYIARQLRRELVGRRIVRATVLWSRSIEGSDPAEFTARVAGCQVTGIGRRGKYLLIELEGEQTLVVHRRMSGNLVFAAPDVDEPYTRVAFELDDGRRLLYTDPRKFGRLRLVAPGCLDAVFAALGPEPLAPEFTPAVLAERLAGQRRPIKAVLLDQAVLAGLGNIYADEALFRGGIHPLRPAGTLSRRQIAALHAGIQGALETGIAHGGTTFGRHRDVYNEAGANLEHVEVYRRVGQPCPRCGTPITRIVVAQRGTHFCPRCQPAPRVRRERTR